jgi:nucleolar protein 56
MGMSRKRYVVVTIDSILLLDEGARVTNTVPLSEDPKTRAGELLSLEEGRTIPQLGQLLKRVSKGTIIAETATLAKALRGSGWGGGVDVVFPSLGGRAIRRHLARDDGRSAQARSVARELASDKTRKSYQNWDRLVIQAVVAVDELDRCMANLYARCREWYAIRFPELEQVIKDERVYAKVLVGGDPRSPDGIPEGPEVSQERRRRIKEMAKRSVGVELEEADLEAIREPARSIIYLDERKSEIVKYIEGLMQDNAPSLTKVADAMVGARLIARAGSIRKLAMMPSTSVQTIGAEKALFRHITKGARPPSTG